LVFYYYLLCKSWGRSQRVRVRDDFGRLPFGE
jgi:hypothetical protein